MVGHMSYVSLVSYDYGLLAMNVIDHFYRPEHNMASNLWFKVTDQNRTWLTKLKIISYNIPNSKLPNFLTLDSRIRLRLTLAS